MESKKIVCAVEVDGGVVMCMAPYLASIYEGTQVEIEGIDGTGTVLMDTIMTPDEIDKVAEKVGELPRILRTVHYSELVWEEETEDE